LSGAKETTCRPGLSWVEEMKARAGAQPRSGRHRALRVALEGEVLGYVHRSKLTAGAETERGRQREGCGGRADRGHQERRAMAGTVQPRAPVGHGADLIRGSIPRPRAGFVPGDRRDLEGDVGRAGGRAGVALLPVPEADVSRETLVTKTLGLRLETVRRATPDRVAMMTVEQLVTRYASASDDEKKIIERLVDRLTLPRPPETS
jgi:hypothetical protein